MSNQKPQAGAPTAPQRPRPHGGSESVNRSSGPDARTAEDTQQLPAVDQADQASVRSAVPTAGAVAQQADERQGGGPQADAQRPPQPAPAPAPARPPEPKPKSPESARKARLRMMRVDPWSVMKLAFALSIALAIVTVVAVTIVWAVLGAAGVWDAINSSVATVLSDNAADFDITDYVGFGRIIGLTLIISAVDIVLITAIATVGAFMYNLAASLLGGLEITLAEDR